MLSLRIAKQEWSAMDLLAAVLTLGNVDRDGQRFDVLVEDGHGRKKKLATLPHSEAVEMLERLSDELRETSQQQFVRKRPHLRKLRLD